MYTIARGKQDNFLCKFPNLYYKYMYYYNDRKINRDDFYNKTQLKERDWTETLIKKYLKDETIYEFPGKYRCQPQKCYLKSVVEKIEELETFKQDLEKAQKRSARMLEVAETKREKNIKDLKNHLQSIKIKDLDDQKLIKQTMQAKKNWYSYTEQYEYESVSADSVDKDTLERWIVNYIRHNLTSYDKYLEKVIKGKIGSAEMYSILKKDILYKIAEKYPKYKQACQKQIEKEEMLEDFAEAFS